MPHSRTDEELLNLYEIDAEAIVKAVKSFNWFLYLKSIILKLRY